MSFRITGINHLALNTTDMDATLRFYSEVLGLKLVRAGLDDIDQSRRHYFLDLNNGHDTLAFFELPERPAQRTMEGGWLNHLSFNVETVAELDALEARLKANGQPHLLRLDHEYVLSIYFRDPVNGITLEASAPLRPWQPNDLFADPDPVATAQAIREQLGLHDLPAPPERNNASALAQFRATVSAALKAAAERDKAGVS